MTKILLVDDHKLFREGLRVLLEMQAGLEVIGEAKDGEEAIKLVQELKPDVIVLDIEMPGMSGIEAASEIVGERAGTKILALSRHSERRYVSDTFAAGASGYILKDSAVEELVNAINTVVSGKLYCSPDLVGVVMEDYTDRLTRGRDSEISKLTPRENEVLILLAEGKNSKEIGAELNVSAKTVDTHRQRIMKKLDMHNIADLIKLAIREGLVDL